MAKSARASSRKANNRRLAANLYGPAESARAERLSARLLEAAKQPKPETSDVNMDAETGADETVKATENEEENDDDMDVDSKKPVKANIGKKRVDKRKQKKAGIVFQRYSDRIKKKNAGRVGGKAKAKASE